MAVSNLRFKCKDIDMSFLNTFSNAKLNQPDKLFNETLAGV